MLPVFTIGMRARRGGAPKFIGATTNLKGVTGGGTVTLGTPAGTKKNDTMVAVIVSSGGVTLSNPGAFTLRHTAGPQNLDGTATRIYVLTKYAGLGESGDHNFLLSAGTGNALSANLTYRWSGADGVPDDSDDDVAFGGPLSQAPDITTLLDNTRVLSIYGVNDVGAGPPTPTLPPGTIERVQLIGPGGGGGAVPLDRMLYICDELAPSAGLYTGKDLDNNSGQESLSITYGLKSSAY